MDSIFTKQKPSNGKQIFKINNLLKKLIIAMGDD